MTGSPQEREIRDAVATYARAGIPNARIIHELVIGWCRADLAAVTPDRIVLFEVKSQKDKLSRLPNQISTFTAAAHAVILVAHSKWFDKTPYACGKPRWAPPDVFRGRHEIWCYPEPAAGQIYANSYRWSFPRPTLEQPRANTMLGLLWKDELLVEARRHRIDAKDRDRRSSMIMRMAWHMTGKEIAEAVCRQLRSRPFAEADPPIIDGKG